VDESGQVSVVSGSWWFAVVSVPLTIATFGLWKYWLYYSIREEERKHASEITPKKEKSKPDLYPYRVAKGHHGWMTRCVSIIRRRHQDKVPENGP
jgi:hypothetical protein